MDNNLRIRKLTPKECWRLMGFDDEDFEKAKKVNSNTQLYKQAGNSIVVNVLERILENLIHKDQHIKILELFGGIGACSKALERLGIEYEIADYVEIDKYAVASFNAMHGTNFQPQDICKWDKDIDCDLIMHGSPCQDFSLAGLQQGGDEGSGTRSSLMYETVRIVEKIKPKYVIWENVKNIISKKHKHNFDTYIYRMEELGYTSYYKVLNAKDYGIPQNRERVFTVSILNDNNYDFPESKKLENMPIDYMENVIDKKYYLTDKNLEWLEEHNKRHKEKGTGFLFKPKDPNKDIANTIRANASFAPTDNAFYEFPKQIPLEKKLKDMLEDNVEEKYYLSDKMIRYISSTGTANFRNHDSKINLDIARPLTTDPNKRAGTTNYLSDDLPDNYNLEPINTMPDGTCRTIKNQYYKTSKANFERTSTYGATGVLMSSQTMTTSGNNDGGVVITEKIDLTCLD